MSQAGGSVSWTSMNENLMALLEAVLTLAASDASASRRPARPTIKPGGYSEEIFLDLTEDEQDEFSCSICYQVLKETMQCLNNHKFCHSCLYVWSTTGQYANRVRCPVCRCQGYYFRNDDLDEKINKKKVKCSMDGCRWSGQLKYMGVHRHTNYGAVNATRTPSYTLRGDESNEDSDEDDDEDESDSTVLELPYLGRAVPDLPHRTQSRFQGTGLQARRIMTTAGAAGSGDMSDNPTVLTTTTPLDRSTAAAATALRQRRNAVSSTPEPTNSMVGGGGGILLRERRNANTLINNNTETTTSQTVGSLRRSNAESSNPGGTALLRERRSSNNASSNRNNEASGSASTTGGAGGGSLRERRSSDANAEASAGGEAPTQRLSVRQRVHPIRRAPVNRITVTHTDSNNNIAAASTNNNSVEGTTATSPQPTPRQPRPPSAPRPANQATRRNLPGLSTAARPSRGQSNSQSTNQGSSASPTHVIRAPPTFNAATASRSANQHSALNNFHDRLQESRDRLEGLMSTFSGELERSRQEMADFQLERERQRREQLSEVRELGRRLGQVASELRQLLSHRTRFSPSESDE